MKRFYKFVLMLSFGIFLQIILGLIGLALQPSSVPVARAAALCPDGVTVIPENEIKDDGGVAYCNSHTSTAVGNNPAQPDPYTCDKVTTPGLTLNCTNKNPIFALLEFAINWLFGIIGGLAALVIIVSGIQFISSQGSPDAIKKAKNRIANAVVGLIVLSLMFFILRLIGI